MRQARISLFTIGLGYIVFFIFWFLQVSFLPAEAFGADETMADPPGVHQVDADNAPVATSTPTVEPQSSTGVLGVYGPIEITPTTLPIPHGNSLRDMIAHDLARVMDIQATDIESATLMCDSSACTDPAAVAVIGPAPGTWFPTRGESFALLSTGAVMGLPATDKYSATVQTAELGSGQIEVASRIRLEALTGLTNTDGGDVVRLYLGLRAPLTATCLALDYTFYTVDLPYTTTPEHPRPEFIGDIFTAQVNAPELRVANGVVDAPGNIAYNQEGEVVATSTMSPTGIYAALTITPGGNIPGVFPLLQLRHPVTGGEAINLYLSIQDVGDAYADSAVALDNFAWLPGIAPSDCQPNPGHSGDHDGDGLPDGWENHGVYTRDAAGTLHYLDLRALGANPDIKDIFVEVDAMQPLTVGGFDPAPISGAMTQIIAAFARAPVDEITSVLPDTPKAYQGIHLHVDYGQTYLKEPPQEYLCRDDCIETSDSFWETLHTIRERNLDFSRSNVYHYALFAHKLFECVGGCIDDIELTSGISANLLPLENGASDFVVSLGDAAWRNTVDPMETQQAGTFMHELGHNLGLNHAGATESEEPDEILNKPNHLSVMNYLYQTSGLVVSDQGFKFDYSRYNMAVLDENFLNESEGILPVQSGINVTYTLGVKHYCAPQDPATITHDASIVDWDCRCGVAGSAPISWNITGDLVSPLDSTEIFSRLPVHNEWDRLVFTGGRLYRQRSLLWPLIADRGQRSPGDTENAEPALLAHGLDSVSTAPHIRQFIVPPPVTTAIAEQLFLEELAPRKTQALRRAAKNFPNLLSTIRDWLPIDLAAPFNDLFDGLIPTAPADRR